VTSNLGAGGAERQVAYVMQGLSADPIPGHGAALAVNSLEATNANDFFLTDVTQSGLPVIDLEIQRQQAAVRQVLATHPTLRPQVQALASLPAELSRVALPLYAHLIETRPQVVHLWQDAINIAGGIAAVVAGVPQIVLCTRSTRPVENRRYRRYLHAGYRALMGYAGEMTIVNNSANGARDYADWLNIPADQIGVFYNGYNFDALRASAAPGAEQAVRAEYGIPEDALVLGGVMRFSAEKRPDLWVETLLEAVAAEPKLYGMIVGDGPMRAALMDQVAAAGLSDRICFPGRQTPVVPFMRAMDMLFLSSVTEGLPNVLIEAQALGVPVATMDVGGATEAVDVGRSGIALQEATPADLAAQILAVLTDTEARTQMAAAAEDFATTQFSLEAMIGTLKRSYGMGGDAPC
jgi:glycosyltransferase involved in cell wall biosynthesis